MRLLIVSDMFSLESWLIDGKEPEIMPAVYEFYNYLGSHSDYTFEAVIAHPSIDKVVQFPNGSKIHIYKLKVPFHYIRKFSSLKFLKTKAENLLKKKNNFTHVYGMTIYANVAKELGIENNIPTVGRLFGSLIWDVLRKGKWFKARTRFHYQMREIKNPCDLTICTEDGTQFDLAIKEYSPNAKVHMMYNGVNEALRKKLLSQSVIDKIESTQEIKFCYIARLTYWKRQDLALDIISLFKERGLNVKLDIYGKGEQEKVLSKKIKELDLANEVSIKGSIPHEQMPFVLSQYHVSMFLYEASNLGNAMWESALAGRLIITRNTGKTNEIFNVSNAIVMQGADKHRVVNEFVKLLDKKIDLSTNVRNTVNELLPNWKDRFDREMEILHQLIK